MKVSLQWILDHVRVTLKEIDVKNLVEELTNKTAEIENVEHVQTDVATLTVATILEQTGDEVVVECLEFKKKVSLPVRKDAFIGHKYLLKREGTNFGWATLVDLGSQKDGLLPAIVVGEQEVRGSWRESFETEDYILHIDNKALTHRPDLWGHRGFAREVAALLQKELIPEDHLLASVTIKHYDHEAPAGPSHPWAVKVEDQTCRRLAVLYLPSISYQPSLLGMATRLARIDARPHDLLVDATNYVMFDIGQPMHAFDAATLTTGLLVGMHARDGEKLHLLDGDEVTLTKADYVISDGTEPLALAGIMGGTKSSVQRTTKSLLIESANFEPAPLRRTATRLKKRTESLARFEKNLDPNQNTQALLRYLKLLDDAGIPYTTSETIVSLGRLAEPKTIELTHQLLENKLGMSVSATKVERILHGLGFGVETSGQNYKVTVPSFRATKDITIAEDLVEEVARFVGYSTLVPRAPLRAMTAFTSSRQQRMNDLKKICAYGLHMHEVHTYAFYDEEFLKMLGYDPKDALRIANPLSEHWQRLITSLVPNLLKCVYTNQQHESMRFFECNRVWFYEEVPVEEQECAGIWYEQKASIDFYDGKAMMAPLFELLGMEVRWSKPTRELEPWYDKNQTAELWLHDRIIGRAGKLSPIFRLREEGDAFMFELDANALLAHERHPYFKPLERYPSTDLDISVIVPLSCTVYGIEQVIKGADARIREVHLIDQFEKPEWGAQKSLTLRFKASDIQGTLTKEDIDTIWEHVVTAVTAIGAQVR